MPVNLVWRPQALEDIEEIYLVIGLDQPDAAERVFSAIESRVEHLVQFPRMGPRRPEIASSARVLVEGSYLILYELDPDSNEGPTESIDIIRIVDGRRELSRLF